MTTERTDPDKLAAFIHKLAQHARTDSYSAFNLKAGRGYAHVREPISDSVIRQHLEGSQPIAVFPLTGDHARIAVLDIDNHDGETSWEQLVERVHPIYADLIAQGFTPLPFRSGGGQGIHMWLVWSRAQPARRIRRFLTKVLARHNLRVGTSGIRDAAVEIYPKQDQLVEGGVGNPIALPLARQSAPLDRRLQPIELTQYEPPELQTVHSPDLKDEAEEASPSSARSPESIDDPLVRLNVVLDGDLDEAQAALKVIPSNDYSVWIRMALALKVSFGDQGFSVWRSWSEASPEKYPGEAECRRIWGGLQPTGSVGLGSLFFAAKENGWNGPSDPTVREMNARFGILTHRNKTLILVKNGDRREEDDFTWLAKPTFLDRLASEKVPVNDGHGATKLAPKAIYWLGHQRASHYHRVIFDPDKAAGENGRDWNLWTGFALKPVPGTWDRLQDHIRENICRGDPELIGWLLNWMALGVQQPAEVIGTAPVLCGFPGTGKGFLANAYGRLWGRHYTTITHHEHVAGRFNAHLVGKRFVFVDEGLFGGNRRDAGIIKTRVTEDWMILEAKGVDPMKIRNRMIFMVASNEASVVPADKGDRRWQVLDVGDRNREDRKYFAEIMAELQAGGYEAMLFDLLHRDISIGPNPRRIIKTEALFEQIVRAQGPQVGYLYQALDEGVLPQQDAPGNGPAATTIRALWEDMRRTQPNAQYVQRSSFGRYLQDVIPGIKTIQSGTFIVRRDAHGRHETERSTRYVFPSLALCRRAFEAHLGQIVPWSNDLTDWQRVESF